MLQKPGASLATHINLHTLEFREFRVSVIIDISLSFLTQNSRMEDGDLDCLNTPTVLISVLLGSSKNHTIRMN
jgi:hypothetical protein